MPPSPAQPAAAALSQRLTQIPLDHRRHAGQRQVVDAVGEQIDQIVADLQNRQELEARYR